ncbi:MAG: Ger(x)C family spore germination protein [Eubacteriales bacterium]|nr:Ger(x)C family spore germination protein [Eubacteriales bacterium]
MRKMGKKLKIVALLLLICLPMLMQAGCGARELNELVIVMGIGMDTDTENPDNIKLVAQIVLPNNIGQSSSAGGSSGSSEKAYCNVESAAENTFEAIREYTHKVCNKLYIAHNQVFVIGREVAERGIADYLDFFIRAKETRPTTTIVIADTTAAEILDVEAKMNLLPAINVNKLIEAQAENSQSREINVQDYVSTMQSETTSFVAPMIHILQEGENQFLSIKGMAVFKEDKMTGELDEDETRGFLWIKGWIESGVINITAGDQQVATEIVSAKTELSAEIKDGEIIMNIKITEDGVIATQTGTVNLATLMGIGEIEALVKEEILNELTLALKKAKELNADIFGFGEVLHQHYSKEWEGIREDWDTVFSKVKVNIEIETNISGAGIITEPALSEE